MSPVRSVIRQTHRPPAAAYGPPASAYAATESVHRVSLALVDGDGDLQTISFAIAGDFSVWLDEHHESSPGLWLQLAKKGSGIASVTYAEAVDVALCFGWIDGQKRAQDETYWLQRFTPRRARSPWSKVNRDKAEALIASGAMRPAGLRQVQLARADGRWDAAYAGMKTATVPDDLAAAIAAVPAAEAFFDTIDRQNRYAMIYRVQDAKRPETRRHRIEKFVTMLAEGRLLYP
jgi:uncharacterized protein YdeI (YjbR/CyaY-like superfamily)